MSKIFILFAVMPHLLCTMVHGTMLCSEYFTYTINPETFKILGRLEITSPPENDEMFYVKVALNVTDDSLNGLFQLELARPIKETIQAIRQGRPLVYHINFPSGAKFPTLSAIWFNNRQYCFGSAAAHCMKIDASINGTIHPNMVEVLLGRFNLFQSQEYGSANLKVASYEIHSNFKNGINADFDLAVLSLKNVVEFNPFIKPICLWSGLTQLEDVINKTGYVVGWGEDELNRRDIEDQQMVMATIVSQETCHWSDPWFVSLTSRNTFCAGDIDGFSPCNGDSGNGLILLNNITGSYELRGVVSRILPGETIQCDPQKYVVYVDVAKYIPWIQRYIST